jgi:hypothetical protein
MAGLIAVREQFKRVGFILGHVGKRLDSCRGASSGPFGLAAQQRRAAAMIAVIPNFRDAFPDVLGIKRPDGLDRKPRTAITPVFATPQSALKRMNFFDWNEICKECQVTREP